MTMASPGRSNLLYKHRFVVEKATFDELDQQQQQRYNNNNATATDTPKLDDSNRDLISVASTVDVDNTHPYLMRYADMYANDSININNLNGASSISTGPTFVDVKKLTKKPPSHFFKEGQKVLYTGGISSGGPSEAIIMKVVHDDENEGQPPQYTIKLTSSGDEQQADGDKLNKTISRKGATDANGDPPRNCVDFKTNPTDTSGLFNSLYRGIWQNAEKRLQSHPEEASVWVARYAKKSSTNPGSSNEREVRWQLLPLHLYIALCGRSKDEAAEEEDVPDDEQVEINDDMQKENQDAKSPPLQLLSALLSAYPQATQCTDDQNMIPLHSAIRGNSSLAIISKLLEADPTSAYRKDARGRNAFILVEKVYGKRIHKEQVGNEDGAREKKYATLMELLSNAARQVSSPTRKSQPKGNNNNSQVGGIPQKDVVKTEAAERQPPPDEQQAVVVTQKERMQHLQNENLALRRENAELHHRAEINSRLLQQLVEKLQMYENQRSIENYNEIFGSRDELSERRGEIMLSISEDNDKDDIVIQEMAKVVVVEEEEVMEEDEKEIKNVGSGGAYHKRLERYNMQSTPTRSKGNFNLISPVSTLTEATEPATPLTPATPFMMLPKLESSDDEGDVGDDTAGGEIEGDEDDIFDEMEVQAKGDGVVENTNDSVEIPGAKGDAAVASGKDAGDKDDNDASSSKAASESDESSVSNSEGQDIFRPRNVDTQDANPASKAGAQGNNTAGEPDTIIVPEVTTANADGSAAKAISPGELIASEPAVAEETADPKIMVASTTPEPEVAEEIASPKTTVETALSSELVLVHDGMGSATKVVSKADDLVADGSSGIPEIMPVLSMEEEDQLQVE